MEGAKRQTTLAFSDALLTSISIPSLSRSRFLLQKTRELPYRDESGAVNLHLVRRCKDIVDTGTIELHERQTKLLDTCLRHAERHFAKQEPISKSHRRQISAEALPKTVAAPAKKRTNEGPAPSPCKIARVADVLETVKDEEKEECSSSCPNCASGRVIWGVDDDDHETPKQGGVQCRICIDDTATFCAECVESDDIIDYGLHCGKCDLWLCHECNERNNAIEYCEECNETFCVQCIQFEPGEQPGWFRCSNCPLKLGTGSCWNSSRDWRAWPKVESGDWGRVYVLPDHDFVGWFGNYNDETLMGGIVYEGTPFLSPFVSVALHRMRKPR